ncbi:MAG TPA: DUF815 domain-containing protein [Fervidobacterium sp.]|nr:DUF815 domain-containing protein [Fervidobacterium sp.]
MSLLGAVLQSLSELGKSKVDSYRHFFDGHRPVEESMESFIGRIVQDFHLDNDIVKGIISGVFAIIPLTSAQLICPIILGIIDYHCKQQTTKQMSDFVTDTIVEEVICAVDELKNANDQKLLEILGNQQQLFPYVVGIRNDLISLQQELQNIMDELKQTGLENIKSKIDSDRVLSQENKKHEISNFYNGIVSSSYIPILKDLDLKTAQMYHIEQILKNDQKKGVLVLGESGSGKSTMIKRITYDFVQDGWNVYSIIKSDFHLEKAIKNLKKLSGKILIAVDDAADCGETLIKELITKLPSSNIKVLMAERREKWYNENGTALIENDLLNGAQFDNCDLKLEESDVEQYLNLKREKYAMSQQDIRDFVDRFKKDALGKPGEFLVLQYYLSTKETMNMVSDTLKRKCEKINDSLSNDEKELFDRVASVAYYGVHSPVPVLERILTSDKIGLKWTQVKIQTVLDSLKNKGHIKIENQRVLTYHPVICHAFFESKEGHQVKLIRDFIDNCTSKERNVLFILGVNIVSELINKKNKNKDKYELAAECLEKVVSMGNNNAYIQYELGFIYSTLGKYKEAEQKYKEAIRLRNGKYPAAQRGLDYLYSNLYSKTKNDT